ELLDGRVVDVAQAGAARLVERSGLHLLEELADHRADPHHLRGLLHQLGDAGVVVVGLLAGLLDHGGRHRAHRLTVGADDQDVTFGHLHLDLTDHVAVLLGGRGGRVGRGGGGGLVARGSHGSQPIGAPPRPRAVRTPQRVRTILPTWPLASISSWARATSSRAITSWTTGCTWPSATNGHTCSTTSAQIAAFCSKGRARRD